MISFVRRLIPVAASLFFASLPAFSQQVKVTDFGALPNSGKDATPGVLRALEAVKGKADAVIHFPKGTYEFWPEHARHGHYFISNHDSSESLAVAIPIENARGLTLDGQGSVFILHGVILPVAILSSERVTLRDFTIDYVTPHVLIAKVLSAGDKSARIQVLSGPEYTVEGEQLFLKDGEWKAVAKASLEVDPATLAVAFHTGDNYGFARAKVKEVSHGVLDITGIPSALKPGNIFSLRNADRPAPGIWASASKDILVSHVTEHSAMGTGFLAQKTENVHLDGFSITLSPGRYFTTIADAVHCSNCKGKVIVENGMFENMLDDGVNVHGSYLHVMKRIGPKSLLLEWGHYQTYGLTFTTAGEHLEFVTGRNMVPFARATVASAEVQDDHHVLVTLTAPLPAALQEGDFVDNTDWRPTLIYRHNTVRRVRARAVLASTTGGVLIEDNRFEQTTLAGVLIPGEARDWFESTPSSDVIVRRNLFRDTNLNQPKAGAITIGPTIDMPAPADGYVHRRITIEDNDFELLGRRLVQTLSVEGLVFRGNRVTTSKDYPAFPAVPAFSFVHTRCVRIEKNTLPSPLTADDLHLQDATLVSADAVTDSTTLEAYKTACTVPSK